MRHSQVIVLVACVFVYLCQIVFALLMVSKVCLVTMTTVLSVEHGWHVLLPWYPQASTCHCYALHMRMLDFLWPADNFNNPIYNQMGNVKRGLWTMEHSLGVLTELSAHRSHVGMFYLH